MSDDDSQVIRTEYVTREFDKDGKQLSETVTVKTVTTPAEAMPDPGFYL